MTEIEVTDDLVHQVARLSRLALSADEVAECKAHFRKILAYIAAFQELDTEGVDPSHFALEESNVHRADEPGPSIPAAEALKNAPQRSPPYFVVPRVVGDPDGAEGGDGS